MSDVPHIFDRKARILRRARAARASEQSFLVLEAAAGVAERAGAANRRFHNALEFGSADAAFGLLKPLAGNWTRAEFGEHEVLDVPAESFDLAVSVLTLHAMNDLPGALIQMRRALKPDGLLVAALFGGDTLKELRESFAAGEEQVSQGASPRVAPFADVRDLGGLLQRAGFNLPVADVERTVARYRAFDTLVADLRDAGETNTLANRVKTPLRRDVLAASLAHYKSHHAEEDGRLRATFDIAYLTGWTPHESQQKPLAPGSAKMRLADALGTSERKAGDETPKRRP
ncbi:MAG: methyltransferase domain-containing protein [Proteobacteria bacterium]|nr:methyltransferase domain-containing protein [Pseudomonadota bacterium]